MAEPRVDVLTGDRVVVAPGRAPPPDTFRRAPHPLPAAVGTCPFCPGNESHTPPEVARTGAGVPDTPGWRVRVVPNLYPIVADAHEVLVFSPAHDHPFPALTDDEVREAVLVLRDRVADLYASGSAYVQAFVNHGRAAGASIEHPHAQIVGLPTPPPRVEALLARFAAAPGDPVVAAIDEARAEGSTLTDGDGDGDGKIVAWCPPASIAPFAVRIAAPDAGPGFERAPDAEAVAVALVLRDALRRLESVLGDPEYNVVVRTAPPGDARPFRWWVDVVPRLTVQAGFEMGTGLHVNLVPAGVAAEALRAAR